MFFFDVQTDAAAGDLSHPRGRGEAGREEQLVGALLIDGILLADPSVLDGHAADVLGIDAPPVVGDVEHDGVALLIGIERHAADGVLAHGPPLIRRLDAVIEGVADDVHERIGQLLDHHLVELRVLAAQHELDLLGQLAGQLAHRA